MSHPRLKHPRTRLARFAVAAAVGVCGLMSAPAALASPTHSISSQVHQADVALHTAASASASANVAVPVSRFTAQLGIAAKLSAELAARAHTPKAELAARAALNLVAGEEAKAQALLNGSVSAAASAKTAALVKADLQVTEAHQVALGELAQLHVTTRAHADALLNAAAGLKVDASSLLGKLVVDTTSDTGNCPPAVYAQLAAKESANVEARIAAKAAVKIANTIDAGGSLLAKVTADEAAQVRALLTADLAAQAQLGGSSSAGGSGSGSGDGSGPADGSGSGATVGVGATVSGSAGSSDTGNVNGGVNADVNASVAPGLSATLGTGVGVSTS